MVRGSLKNVIIRKLEEADIPAVIKLEKEYGLPSWAKTSFYGTTNFVAEFGGDIIGFLEASYVLDEGTVNNIACVKAYRKCGVATKLFDALLHEFNSVLIRTVYLEVRRSNLPAISFYKKSGFEEFGIRKNYYKDPFEDAILMMLKLR